jgi:predicted site-specific integrase-resolvase
LITVLDVPEEQLLTTTEAAKRLGIGRGTLAGYVRRGWVRPFLTLPSGQHRWKLDDLVEQIRALRDRDQD